MCIVRSLLSHTSRATARTQLQGQGFVLTSILGVWRMHQVKIWSNSE